MDTVLQCRTLRGLTVFHGPKQVEKDDLRQSLLNMGLLEKEQLQKTDQLPIDLLICCGL